MVVSGDSVLVKIDGNPIESEICCHFDNKKLHVKKMVCEPFSHWMDKIGSDFNVSIDNDGPSGIYTLKHVMFKAETREIALCFLTFEKK